MRAGRLAPSIVAAECHEVCVKVTPEKYEQYKCRPDARSVVKSLHVFCTLIESSRSLLAKPQVAHAQGQNPNRQQSMSSCW